jgi:coniferyl-aldehyde dehydrogenase
MSGHTTASAAEMRMHELFNQQRAAFAAHPFPDPAQRKTYLKALKRQLQRYQDQLVDALSRDFGFHAPAETRMMDILGSVLEINHAISHVRRWMRSRRRSTELLFLSNSLRIHYQPKGVVGVIAPWNFPVYLALGPLAAALAAGNRVMLKLSESTPATNAVLTNLLAEAFPEDWVAVVGAELEDPNLFTELPFDHIVFTGSPAVGRAVMRTAAQNLTPVTLELGGKSPALLLPGCNPREAATRIAHGKGVNAGQICIAPDYALVPLDSLDAFVEGVQDAFQRTYGSSIADHPDYTAIINDRHAQRIHALLEDARSKGARVKACAEQGAGRRVPLHIVTGLRADMRLMQEEIFGPILPVLVYQHLEEAIAHINAGSRPLALYCFGHDASARQRVLEHTHSGGVTINDWGWHVLNHDAPFGGVGNSGMGSYHGEEGFRELSHARTVFKRHRWFPVGLFYPPYGNVVQRLVLRLWLGRGDPSLPASAPPQPQALRSAIQ